MADTKISAMTAATVLTDSVIPIVQDSTNKKADISLFGATGFLVYTALLTQSGTDDPVATALQNTLGGEVVWTRNALGVYRGTLAGAFTLDKTIIPPFGPTGNVCIPATGVSTVDYYQIYPSGTDYIVLATYSDELQTSVEWSASQMGGNPIFVEVRVYL